MPRQHFAFKFKHRLDEITFQLNPNPDHTRRFGGTARLWGADALSRLQLAHVVVVGIGGVGSWAAECLARSGVGTLTLIDLDVVALSNVNRQIHATDATLGANKVDVMAQRIRSYAPDCAVHTVDDWITPANVGQLIPASADYVIDCIDQVQAKTSLAVLCGARKQPLIVCGAAGGKWDLSLLHVADLAQVTHDPLLAAMRTRLRKSHGYPAAAVSAKSKTKTKAMGLRCVFVAQAVARPLLAEANTPASANTTKATEAIDSTSAAPQGLSCAGYGSVMHMTASMGIRAAGLVLGDLVAQS